MFIRDKLTNKPLAWILAPAALLACIALWADSRGSINLKEAAATGNISALKGWSEARTCGEIESGGLLSYDCNDWETLKAREAGFWNAMVEQEQAYANGTSPKLRAFSRLMNDYHKYWLYNWHETFTCTHQERLGVIYDGGKWICNPSQISAAADREGRRCLVYSFGSNNEFSFEEAIFEATGCEIHTFDPTVGISPSNKPKYVHFHPTGLDAVDRPDTAIMSWESTLKMLHHTPESHPVDIFKIDIEGPEWAIFFSTLESGQLIHVRQILVEFHLEPSKYGIADKSIYDMMEALHSHGFYAFHREPNLYNRCCIEYSFIRLDNFNYVD